MFNYLYLCTIVRLTYKMACSNQIIVYISDLFVDFPYDVIETQRDAGGAVITDLTIFVPTFEDEKVINTEALNIRGFTTVRVLKHVPRFEPDEQEAVGVVVYWNAISNITKLGVGKTNVYNVVLSDNLFGCNSITIHNVLPEELRCPLQVGLRYNHSNAHTILVGELAGDSQEMAKARDENLDDFVICFRKETPMGIKILNTKRFLILLSARKTRARFSVYLTNQELATVHKELSWESTRRVLRGGLSSNCTVLNKKSYQYVLDALELLGIDNTDISSVHKLLDVFNPLILRYKLVPDVFIQLNLIGGKNKHVRLYCKHEGVAITNAGPVPINLPTRNPKPFTHHTLKPPSERLYQILGTRNVFLHTPIYNYFL
ncbi:ORF48 [Agrotis segetum granulovirus]|uniref:DUF673 superfamily protein n=1 Tax=Agrotis segetum granulosis virus TaxID=10464 RepID=Q6QXK7_GVAS|nr:DUF673 superfamily protein [Agrotis segetum granulovirus]AAS82690.1 ORF48 [Agrotis segetum granulovirus]AHN92096.1 hypothetical protein AsGV057 [Agrotis segetum granulovirus]AKN63331.1 DUF673 superfamily protein [Agrotis segetum granulovirus]